VETPRYEVVRRIDGVEVRKYPQMLLATARGDDDLFNILFRYISGANERSSKISMTSPVITPEQIAMTSPVVSQRDSMSFIVPSSYNRDTVPKPTDPRISIEELPSRTLAVLRFSGLARSGTVDAKKKTLIETLTRNRLKIKGEVVLMRYNPPFTPWFLRRNEVAVEVEG
jgi:effector-binding domain-containing protein